MADWGYEHGKFEPDDGPVVLLVEDEMIIAFDIADQLTRAGFHVDGPYPSNAKALAAIGSGRPDAAILDVQLADGDAYPVAAQLCAMGVPIVFHSGHAHPDDLCTRYPEALVCSKPCPDGRLEAALRSLIRLRA